MDDGRVPWSTRNVRRSSSPSNETFLVSRLRRRSFSSPETIGTTLLVPGTTLLVSGTTLLVPGTTLLVSATTLLVSGTTLLVPGTTLLVSGTTLGRITEIRTPSRSVRVNRG